MEPAGRRTQNQDDVVYIMEKHNILGIKARRMKNPENSKIMLDKRGKKQYHNQARCGKRPGNERNRVRFLKKIGKARKKFLTKPERPDIISGLLRTGDREAQSVPCKLNNVKHEQSALERVRESEAGLI